MTLRRALSAFIGCCRLPTERNMGEADDPVKLGSFRLVCRQVVAGPCNASRSNRSRTRACLISVIADPATMNNEGLADASAANLFRLPRLHPGIGQRVRPAARREALCAAHRRRAG